MPKYAEAIRGVVSEINECRENPAAYAYRLESWVEMYAGNVRYRDEDVPVLTTEGVSALSQAISQLKRTPPSPPLLFSPGLFSAAQLHCEGLGAEGGTSHQGDLGLRQRLAKFGHWGGKVVEALDFGSIAAREVVVSLLIDDGLPTREHRTALVSPDYRLIGVGFGPHEAYKSVCTVLLATKFSEHEGATQLSMPPGVLLGTWEARGWLEGAVRLNCEITSDMENDVMVKRVVKTWEMQDGSERRTEEVIYDALA